MYEDYVSKRTMMKYGWLASLENDEEYHFGFVKKDGNELIGSGFEGIDDQR